MKINATRGIVLLALTMVVGSAVSWAAAQRGIDDGDGFGPASEERDPMVLDEAEGRDRDRGRRGGFRLDDAGLETAYEIVATLYPDVTDRLEAMRDEDPRQFKQTLERRFPRVRFLVQLKERDPAMFDLRMQDITLDRQTDALARQLREARTAEDKNLYEDLRDQIEEKVAEHFDIRQQIRAMEIEKLKLKIEELEEVLDERDDDRRDLIEIRVNELAGPDW